MLVTLLEALDRCMHRGQISQKGRRSKIHQKQFKRYWIIPSRVRLGCFRLNRVVFDIPKRKLALLND